MPAKAALRVNYGVAKENLTRFVFCLASFLDLVLYCTFPRNA